YRLTLYAPRSVDPTEATILTPAAGAPHSDPFQIISLPGVTGWKPYLDIPTGRTGRIDVLRKGTDIGQMIFAIVDAQVAGGTGNAQRWATAFFGDAVGRARLAGCKVVCDESLDGG